MSTNRNKPTKQNDKRRRAARYIGKMTTKLADLAHTQDCDVLCYLLELATMEADIIAGGPSGQLPS
jgi:hypothetical protein